MPSIGDTHAEQRRASPWSASTAANLAALTRRDGNRCAIHNRDTAMQEWLGAANVTHTIDPKGRPTWQLSLFGGLIASLSAQEDGSRRTQREHSLTGRAVRS